MSGITTANLKNVKTEEASLVTPVSPPVTESTKSNKQLAPTRFRTMGTGNVTMYGIKFTREWSEPITNPEVIKRCRKFKSRIEEDVDYGDVGNEG